jgi:hypothetical protein
MNTKTFIAFVALMALLLFVKLGVSRGSIVAVLVVATLAAIPWYFGTRDGSAEPSALERVLATLWLLLRRIVGIGAGTIFLWAGWDIARSGATASDAMSPLVVGPLIAFLGLFCIYIGIVGQGSNRADWRDDVELYRRNKHRYKWWF